MEDWSFFFINFAGLKFKFKSKFKIKSNEKDTIVVLYIALLYRYKCCFTN